MQQEAQKYDLIVIGAGSGGMGSGRKAAAFGKKVAMIENRVIGGTCVNVGCVPKKVMFNLAGFMEDAHLFKDYGVTGTESLKLDWKTFKSKRDAYVKRLNGIYTNNVSNSGIDYFHGTAAFVDNKQVSTSEGRLLEADHIMIASGSYPQTPQFPGAEHCWSSDDIFSMDDIPASMVVIGGGYIGIEMAQILQALGCKVTLVVRSQMLRGHVDQEIIPTLQENMTKLGLEYRVNCAHTSVEKINNCSYKVNLKDGTSIEAERVLCAIGRPPNTEALKLENAGVKLDNKGAIQVDDYQNTNVEGIYAIGDVTNQVSLTPVAIRQGRLVSQRIFNGENVKMNYDNIATVIFSHPPIGSVGLTEELAKAKWGEEAVLCYRSKFVNMYYSPADTQEKKQSSFFKTITHIEEDKTERVVGVFAIGKGVDEMMQGISIAVTMGATKQDFDNSVAIHPTASEEWVLMDANFTQ
jgi:glutathione reductase (NADPH)